MLWLSGDIQTDFLKNLCYSFTEYGAVYLFTKKVPSSSAIGKYTYSMLLNIFQK
jgi:hypothetical protein